MPIRLNSKQGYVAAMTDWKNPPYRRIVEHLAARSGPRGLHHEPGGDRPGGQGRASSKTTTGLPKARRSGKGLTIWQFGQILL